MVAAQDFVVFYGPVELIEAEENGGQAISGGGISLVKLQDLLIVVEGGVDVSGAFVAKGQGKAESRVWAVGFQNIVKLLDSTVVISEAQMGQDQSDAGLAGIAGEAQGGGKVLGGQLKRHLLDMQQAELEVVVGAFGVATYFSIQLRNVVGGSEAGQIVGEKVGKISDKLAA